LIKLTCIKRGTDFSDESIKTLLDNIR
jgi:hypothetical protein